MMKKLVVYEIIRGYTWYRRVFCFGSNFSIMKIALNMK